MEIAQFWDNLAEKYAAKPVANQEAYERKLDETKSRLTPEDTVLDIGCGTGSLALELAPCVSHVHSVDVSSEMLRIAKGKAEKQGVDNVTFHNRNVDDLSVFDRDSFDMVCAYNIVHLADDAPALLQAVYELLKPGGYFVSTTPCLKDGWMPYGLIIGVMRLQQCLVRCRRSHHNLNHTFHMIVCMPVRSNRDDLVI